MDFEPIEDIDGDFLHLGYRGASTYFDPRYLNTISIEIEMVSCDNAPCLYFNADRLRDLAKKLTEAADFLETQGA
jgi:hypothetical protein